MPSEQTTSETEVVEQADKSKKFKINKEELETISKNWNFLDDNLRLCLKNHESCIKIQANWRGYNLRLCLKNDESCIKIQANWRGYNLRKEFKKLNDNYNFKILIRCLDKYISDIDFINEINSLMSRKKIRNEKFSI